MANTTMAESWAELKFSVADLISSLSARDADEELPDEDAELLADFLRRMAEWKSSRDDDTLTSLEMLEQIKDTVRRMRAAVARRGQIVVASIESDSPIVSVVAPTTEVESVEEEDASPDLPVEDTKDDIPDLESSDGTEPLLPQEKTERDQFDGSVLTEDLTISSGTVQVHTTTEGDVEIETETSNDVEIESGSEIEVSADKALTLKVVQRVDEEECMKLEFSEHILSSGAGAMKLYGFLRPPAKPPNQFWDASRPIRFRISPSQFSPSSQIQIDELAVVGEERRIPLLSMLVAHQVLVATNDSSESDGLVEASLPDLHISESTLSKLIGVSDGVGSSDLVHTELLIVSKAIPSWPVSVQQPTTVLFVERSASQLVLISTDYVELHEVRLVQTFGGGVKFIRPSAKPPDKLFGASAKLVRLRLCLSMMIPTTRVASFDSGSLKSDQQGFVAALNSMPVESSMPVVVGICDNTEFLFATDKPAPSLVGAEICIFQIETSGFSLGEKRPSAKPPDVLLRATMWRSCLRDGTFTSCAPAESQMLKYWIGLDVNYIALMWPLPTRIRGMLSLEPLKVAHNMLDESIPEEICSLPEFQNIMFSYNLFTRDYHSGDLDIRLVNHVVQVFKRKLSVGDAVIVTRNNLAEKSYVGFWMLARDEVVWNSMVYVFFGNGFSHGDFYLYVSLWILVIRGYALQEDRVPFTFYTLCTACSVKFDGSLSVRIHAQPILIENSTSGLHVGIILNDMFVEGWCLEHEHQVLDEMTNRNLIALTSLIAGQVRSSVLAAATDWLGARPRRDRAVRISVVSGYTQNAKLKEALELLKRMQNAEVKLVGTISACAQREATKYANWYREAALKLLQDRLEAVREPNDAIFVGVTTACSRTGDMLWNPECSLQYGAGLEALLEPEGNNTNHIFTSALRAYNNSWTNFLWEQCFAGVERTVQTAYEVVKQCPNEILVPNERDIDQFGVLLSIGEGSYTYVPADSVLDLYVKQFSELSLLMNLDQFVHSRNSLISEIHKSLGYLKLLVGLFSDYAHKYSYIEQHQVAVEVYKIDGVGHCLFLTVYGAQLQVLYGKGWNYTVGGISGVIIVFSQPRPPDRDHSNI